MVRNLFADLPDALPEELVETLAENGQVRIERIVSTGHVSPEGYWYDQDECEWILVLQGAARIQFADRPEPVTMGRGDFVNIEAHRRHRVAWTTPEEPTVWLAVFYRQ